VLRVAARSPYLVHLEFISGHDAAELPAKLLVRNGLLDERHRLPVRSVAVVLRPEADSPQLTGRYQREFPGENEPYLVFRYHVLRIWQLSPQPLLTSGLSLLPLAPISAVTEADLPSIMERMGKRLAARRARRQAATIWAASYVLLGLRYSSSLAEQLFRGVLTMKESTTYRAILEEGREEGAVAEAKRVLRLLGDDALGAPDDRSASAIERLDDLATLESLLKRLRTVENWKELLGKKNGSGRGRR
jgi:predicted transposase YdaD